jgi:para-nitrobenzyl esterase
MKGEPPARPRFRATAAEDTSPSAVARRQRPARRARSTVRPGRLGGPAQRPREAQRRRADRRGQLGRTELFPRDRHRQRRDGDGYETSLQYLFGNRAADVLRQYPLSSFPAQNTAAYALSAVWTDASVFLGLGGCQYANLAGQILKYQPKTFLYRFDAPTPAPAPAGFDFGAVHGSDQADLWPTPTSVYNHDKLRLSAEMVRYWGAFVRQGTPDAPGHAEWPSVPAGRAMVLQLGSSSSVTAAEFSAAQHCDLWNSFAYKWLDIDPDQLAQRIGVARQ